MTRLEVGLHNTMRRFIHLCLLALAGSMLVVGTAVGHELDHPAPALPGGAPPAMSFNAGGEGAEWDFLASNVTGNPHSDIDFFTQGDTTYVSVGTLGTGANGGGQSIFKVAEGGDVGLEFVSSAPTASCLSDPSASLGLQHDVEATPKGNTILNTDVLTASRRDTQLLVDASDAPGRCHDQGDFGLVGAPLGGLEIIDVTDPADPQTIGMTSHIGEAHTVNIDPKRPHIAYAVTSDGVGVDDEGKRENEEDGFELDGFEVVDLSSCMNFPVGATLEQKRAACRPEVYRYRYPTTEMALGHTNTGTLYGCHELEIYPDDRLTCGSGQAMILLDMAGAFDDNGTPADYLDDKPNGTPLPCRERESSSAPPFTTGATIMDCVTSETEEDALSVAKWLAAGAPSLQGVEWLGTAFHMGRESTTGAASPAFDSTEDIDFNHESEFTHSGSFVLSTDERGGGVAPPGASCDPVNDLPFGNGGIHAYRADKLLKRAPASPEDAFSSYAPNSEGEKAIFRAPIRTQSQGSLCTAHVFQQIPGQNRIFMGWYSQGTRVVDFTEKSDGTIDFKEAGWFIPSNANQWVSHVFRVDSNADGGFTYYGLAADFFNRNSVELYKVTLPPPPAPLGRLRGTGTGFAPPKCLSRRVKIKRRGIGRLRVGRTKRQILRRAGRPVRRTKRVWRYCIKREKKARAVVVFDKRGRARLVATNAKRHRFKRIGRGTRAAKVRGARRVGRGLRLRGRRVIFKVRGGRVRAVAVAHPKIARKPAKLRRFVKKTRLR